MLGKLVATIDDEGYIYLKGKNVGYIQDEMDIFLGDVHAGEINARRDLVFDGKTIDKLIM
jgi:hypothetical protein